MSNDDTIRRPEPNVDRAADTVRQSGPVDPHASTMPVSKPGASRASDSFPAAASGAPTVARTPAGFVEDINADKLLMHSPKIEHQGRQVPGLGGIPLLSKLGQGGMGAVYYGIHPRLQQEVAVKVLPYPLMAQNPDMIGRFFREAQIAARVKSPHLVSVLDVNEEAGLFYLVMEFVNGVSVGTHIKQTVASGARGLDEATALDICIAATAGLAAAHDENVVHRDIKPDNIMIPRSKQNGQLVFAQAKLADLGLARSEDSGGSLTGTHTAMGTPGYMSPEQAMDAKTVKKPGDVFSMGATLYAMLSGKPPFTGRATTKVILDTIQTPHVPIAKVCPEVSPGTAALLERCLKKEASERLASAHELLEGLKSCREYLGKGTAPTLNTRPLAANAPGVVMGERSAPSSVPPAGTVRRPAPNLHGPERKSYLLPGVAGGVLLLALVVYLATRAGGQSAFERDRQALLNAAKPALKEHGQELERARKRLEDFVAQNAERSVAELQPVTAAIEELRTRGTALENRQKSFDAALQEAARMEAAQPAEALAKYRAAQALGQADAAQGLPSLLTALNPTLEQRMARLKAPPGTGPAQPLTAEAQAAYQAAMDSAQRSFASRNLDGAQQHYAAALKLKPGDAAAQAGLKQVEQAQIALLAPAPQPEPKAEPRPEPLPEPKPEPKAEPKPEPKPEDDPKGPLQLMAQVLEARRKGDWQRVAALLEQAAEKRPLSDELKNLLEQARTNLKQRAALDAKLRELDAAMQRQDYAAAQRAGKEAAALNPTPEQQERIDAALKSAQSATVEQAYFKAMESAREAMDNRRFQEAVGFFQAALAAKPNDPEATMRLEHAKAGLSGGGPKPPPGEGKRPPPPPRRP